MKAAFRLPPLLLPLCMLIAGIAAAGSFNICLPDWLLPLFIFLSFIILCTRSTFLLGITLCVTLLVAGNLAIQPLLTGHPEQRALLDESIGKQFIVEGVIVTRPQNTDTGARLVLRVEHLLSAPLGSPGSALNIVGLVQLNVGSRINRSLFTGDRIRFSGRLRPPRNLGIPGEFNAERYYALKNIIATSFVKDDQHILLLRQEVEAGLQRHFDMVAKNLGNHIMSQLPVEEGGILKALLIGDTGDIPQSLKDAYSLTGVNHILSISGFHVGIIVIALIQFWSLFTTVFPELLLYLNFRRVACLISLPAIIYYMFLSGAAPATARSVLMLILLMAGLLLERETDAINSLSAAALALLTLNPANLFDISFQLSFLALWGITVLTPLLLWRIPAARTWQQKLILFAAASIAAVTVTLIPVAYYFQQTSLTGIISNFLIVPLLGYGAVVTGVAALPLVYIFPYAANCLIYLAGQLTTLANRIIALLVHIPPLPVFSPSVNEVIIFLFGLLFITVLRNMKARASIFAGTPIVIILMQLTPVNLNDRAMKIHFLSVGQGESTLIIFPNRQSMLIDGGGALHENGRDVGRQLLVPALRSLGIHRVDYLVLTHAHPDHLQGVKSVATLFDVGQFWETGLNHGKDYDELQQILLQRKVSIKRLCTASPEINISDVKVRCLYPQQQSANIISGVELNDTSLVLQFAYGNFSAMFTGDIGVAVEQTILNDNVDLCSTLLKIPHHGSRYSSSPEFLLAVAPKIAVISSGYRNNFGLPAAETIDKLHCSGARIYRTDLDGTISVIITEENKTPSVSTYKRQIN